MENKEENVNKDSQLDTMMGKKEEQKLEPVKKETKKTKTTKKTTKAKKSIEKENKVETSVEPQAQPFKLVTRRTTPEYLRRAINRKL